MKLRLHYRTKKAIVNTFGAIGYISICFQWLWATMLYFSVIQSATTFINTSTSQPASSDPSFTVTIPTPVAIAITVLVTVFMVAITIYAIVAVPKSIAKTSDKIVQKTAKKATEITIKMRHKQNTKQNRASLTPKMIVIIKAVAVLVPVIVALGSKFIASPVIDYPVAAAVSGVIAGASIGFFLLQYTLGAMLRITLTDLR